MLGLSDLRRYSDTMIAKVVIFTLASTFFVGFGMMAGGGQGGIVDGAVVAYVEGEPITNREVAVAHQRLYRNYQDQLGDQLTEDLLKQLNLRFQALNMLIERTVLLKEAGTRGLTVGKEELKKYMFEVPAFQNEEGHFDKNRYKQVLAAQRPALSPGQFEKQTREQLLAGKLENYVKANIHLREDEILREFLMDTREVDIDFLRFDADNFEARIKIKESDIRDFYETNINDYITGEQADIRLISFSPAAYIEKTAIDEDAIRANYDSNKSKYETKEEVRASHILLKLEEGASKEKEDEVLDQAKSLMDRAEKGENFSDLATEFSEDKGSARNGGSLGWFGEGQMVKPFEKAAFEAKVGTVVGPVKTRFGYHVIKVLDHQEPGITPLSEVHDQIETELRIEQASKLADTAAESVQSSVALGQSLDQALQNESSSVTDRNVRIGSADAGKGDVDPEVFKAVFEAGALADGSPKLVKTSKGSAIVIVTGRSPSEPKPLATVRSQIERKVAKDKALTIAAEQSAAALERLKEDEPLKKVARRYKVAIENTGPFTVRDTEIPVIGKNNEILNAAFVLSESAPAARSTYRVNNTYYVLFLKSKREPTAEDYQMERDVRKIELLNERRSDAWRQYIRSLKVNAEIELENPPADILPRG